MSRKKKHSLLWKISNRGENNTSYLFGTMHVKDQRVFQLVPDLEQYILECDSFAAEFDLQDADPEVLNHHLKLPELLTLDKLLKPKQFRKLARLFHKATGANLNFFNDKTPFFIISMLTESFFQKEMPYALDTHLYNFARDSGKKMLGIESFAEQVEILKKLTLEDQLKSVIRIIKHPGSFRKQHLKASDYYQSQDIFTLYKAVRKGARGMRKLMIYDRNKIMAERICKLTDSEPLFIAIGAGHLAGEKGVLRLLKKNGLNVKPVRLKSQLSEMGK